MIERPEQVHALIVGHEDRTIVREQPRRCVQRGVDVVRELIGVEERPRAALDDHAATRELEVDLAIHFHDHVRLELELVELGHHPARFDLHRLLGGRIDERLRRGVAEDLASPAGPDPAAEPAVRGSRSARLVSRPRRGGGGRQRAGRQLLGQRSLADGIDRAPTGPTSERRLHEATAAWLGLESTHALSRLLALAPSISPLVAVTRVPQVVRISARPPAFASACDRACSIRLHCSCGLRTARIAREAAIPLATQNQSSILRTEHRTDSRCHAVSVVEH